MSAIPTTITLEVNSAEQEALVRQFHAMVLELDQLALTAPAGQVVDLCEAAVLERGQQVNCQVLQQAVRRRIAAREKKGVRCRAAPVARTRENRGPRSRQVVSCLAATCA